MAERRIATMGHRSQNSGRRRTASAKLSPMPSDEDALRSLELAEQAQESFDLEGVITHLSGAIRAFTDVGDRRQAAMACVRLGDAFSNGLGNATAGRAWFARAEAMLRDEPPCIEQGWVAVAAMGCDVADPDHLLACAQLALDRARQFGDVNLETKALADGGLAHVQAGRIAEGMAMLDEAMALACGPADDVDTAGKSACSFFTACYYSADFERADAWSGLLRRRGVIGDEVGAPIFLSNHCDTVHACLLCEMGRWSDAEALLERASQDFERATGQPGFHPTILLADLRIRQGRFADAEAMLLGREQTFEGFLPSARLHLHRGDLELAAATARRGLRAMGPDHLRAIELLTVLADALLALGDLASAREVRAELEQRVETVDNPILRARSAPAQARVLAASGDRDRAVEMLETSLDALGPAQAPYQRVRLLLAAARLRDAGGDHAGARIDARTAATALAELDVVLDADDRALLQRLDAADVSAGSARTATLRPVEKWWAVSLDGIEVRVRDTKGMRYLSELLARPGIERHVLDLVDRIEGVGDVDRRRLGDAGELADSTARAAYRRRLEDLRARIDDALAAGMLEDAEAMQAEHDELVQQLAQAFGLGGRSRRASSAAERSRLNVTRAIRSAISTVAGALPEAGASLDRSIRTGMYCVHDPEPGEIRWIVQSGVNEIVPS